MPLDQANAALIGAAIGAAAGILGAYLTGLRQAMISVRNGYEDAMTPSTTTFEASQLN